MTLPPPDKRPAFGAWAPGDCMNKCLGCSKGFIGDKRALNCADCAYDPKRIEYMAIERAARHIDNKRNSLEALLSNCRNVSYGTSDAWTAEIAILEAVAADIRTLKS